MSSEISMQPIKSVALTCDFLRVRPGQEGFLNFQLRNLVWLEKLIGAQTSWIRWGVKTSIVTAPTEAEAFKSSLQNDEIFSRYLQDSDRTWSTLYDAPELNIFPKILEALLRHDLVVGFELPPVLKKTLNQAGKKYISIYIHPVRFLRDLCFLVTTNCDRIANIAKHGEISPNEIEYQSRRFSAMFSRLESPALALPKFLPVVIGQTKNDSVLIRDGDFTNWDDYEDEISQSLECHSEILFLEHPYSKNNALSTEYFRGKHGKTVISFRGNSYGVIFSELAPPFYLTLASSLGVEAEHVGHKCIFLSQDPREKFILNGIDVAGAGIASHFIIKDEFWKNIFSGKCKDKKLNKTFSLCEFPLGDHFVRNSLESWGFDNLRSGSYIAPVTKRVIPSATLTEDRLFSINTILCADSQDSAKQLTKNGHIERSWGTVEVLSKPLSVGMHANINFAHASNSHYLVKGFHSPENWGVWSSAKDAKIVIPLDLMNIQKLKVDISMFVKVCPEILANAPVLQILLNDRDVGCALFRSFSGNDQKIEFSGLVDIPVCKLDFHISHLATPELSDTFSDSRDLGFGIYALDITLSLLSDIQEEECNTYKIWGLQQDDMNHVSQPQVGTGNEDD